MIFEAIMMVCFGTAWPLSVYKSHRSKTNKGKSIAFLYTILFGYIAGIIYKMFFNYDWVIYLYIINFSFVSLDILLFYKNNEVA